MKFIVILVIVSLCLVYIAKSIPDPENEDVKTKNQFKNSKDGAEGETPEKKFLG